MTEPFATIICAMSSDRVIGRGPDIPWHFREDLQHFKRTTLGHAVVMGRKTFESMGKPLKERRNIVVTRQPDYAAEGIETASDVESALALARATDPEPFVLGGSQIYAASMPWVKTMILTFVPGSYDGDVFFPEWEVSEWREVERREGETPGLVFVRLDRA